MNKSTILILGGRSDIGLAVAHRFASQGYFIQLAARNVKKLKVEKTDIELRYNVAATTHEFDALKTNTHEDFVTNLPLLPDIVVCVVGLLGDQKENEFDPSSAIKIMRSNYEGPANILGVFANHFEKRGAGTLIGVSSVAGDRGRATNYVYGSAKAGFSAFLSGLRNRLTRKGVHVVTILPGFVYTKMTENIELPVLLTAQPLEVAVAIERSIQKKHSIVYIKAVWELIMMVIRHIPENIFKYMKI